MRADGENFFRYVRRLSERHRAYFQSRPLEEERVHFFTETAKQSLREQSEIEAGDGMSFDEFLSDYFARQ